MKRATFVYTLVSLSLSAGVLVGCGDYNGGKQISSTTQENKEPSNFGSATDIAPSNSPDLQTNRANAADIGIGGPLQSESGNYQNQPLTAQASDEELAKKVKVALTTGSMGTTGTIPEGLLTKIDVKVNDGVVTLSGPVSSEGEKETIGKQVSGYKGVKSVQNNLTVGGRSVEDKPLEPLVPRSPGNQ